MLDFRLGRRRLGGAGTITNHCMCTILAFVIVEQLPVTDGTVNYCNN